ncbi:kinase/pyrophosphorylase [Brevibacillus sp. LEMMJ03]|uniref:Putative pyruvate, phosphate dikinase regulatory protein n=2 Tax=Brevibacillus TaxID=55080 RepID=A0A9X3Z3J9_9BACL|nr:MULTISPECIES: pyruvate, water dikinase regulatory protein [Brevibacillus]MDA5108680.1 kinase/pyrophosphorylase [Brevibacillus thermoruber]TRY26210.1 kinase/pyrophosphorylase [Brevibacillus sp. LEMMJ03]UYZ15591.1 kinase/pyrophosphorylase [Brevibacillus sp. WF146]
MHMAQQAQLIYVVSDSIGETAELVVRAVASQFDRFAIDVHKYPYIEDKESIDEIIASAKESKAMIVFTLVVPELKSYIVEQAARHAIPVVDVMGPLMNTLQEMLHEPPIGKPGLVRRLDEEYFRKVDAIEFAVKYDDGRDPRGLLRADVVLIGVSRTSKTPLSMYLANKRLKVANVPLVPEVEPPEELFQLPPERCIGLTINPEQLNSIRTERLKALGLTAQANYANLERINEELAYSQRIMKRIGCPVIDVSNKAVEETANIILEMIRKNKLRGEKK